MRPSRSTLTTSLWIVGLPAVVVVLVAVSVVIVFPGPSAEQEQARTVGSDLLGKLNGLDAGDTVDLVATAGVPWDRAIVFAAYMSGTEMNQLLGFDWYGNDDVSGSDESQQRLVLVAGQAVVADMTFGPDDHIRLDDAIDRFDRSAATFVAQRDEAGNLVLSPSD